MYNHHSPTFSLIYCLASSACYVLILYIIVPSQIRCLPRNHTSHIKWRMSAVCAYTLLATLLHPLIFCSNSEGILDGFGSAMKSLGWSWQWKRDTIVILHAISLFLGPILCGLLTRCLATPSNTHYGSAERWMNLRDYIIGPISEEMVFRALFLPPLLLACQMNATNDENPDQCFPFFSLRTVQFLCPTFFGVAHFHHALIKIHEGHTSLVMILLSTLFQFSYTYLFGLWSTFAYMRTGSVVCVSVCHAFCNYMGVPNLGFMDKHGLLYQYKALILPTYAVGIALFYRGFFNDVIYGSHEDGLLAVL